jgi:phosphocarrier protein FPr
MDGRSGRYYPMPDDSVRRWVEVEQERLAQQNSINAEFRHAATGPVAGHAVRLMANVQDGIGVEAARAEGAEGIGLYRTEFLFSRGSRPPTEQEQFETYAHAVKAMDGRPVVFRTLDAGGDKPFACLNLPREANPFLGIRGLRFSLANPGLFGTQLRAILRAAALGQVSLMFPMVAMAEEVHQAKWLVQDARRQLADEGLDAGPCPVGIMVETPAAALIASQLATQVAFMSIGSNDLVQYTMAADRSNAATAYLASPYHPAILTLVDRVASAAAGNGITWSVCGESAADPLLAMLYLAWGAQSLSLAPPSIPAHRRFVNQTQFAAEALDPRVVTSMETADEVKHHLAAGIGHYAQPLGQ